MLSYIKEEDDQGNVSRDDSSSEKSSSGNLSEEGSQATSQASSDATSGATSGAAGSKDTSQSSSKMTSLADVLKDGSDVSPDSGGQDYLAPSSTGKKVKYSTVILGVVFLVGAASLFFMITKFGPNEANAGISDDEMKIEAAITRLSGSKTKINSRMNEIVDRISSLSKVEQVSVDQLKRNPFVKDSEGVGASSPDDDYRGLELKLWSIMYSGGVKSCVINGRLYQVGGRVGDFTVKRIGGEFVELDAGQSVLVLRMSK